MDRRPRSIESQLASADRLKALSPSTADRLRLTQARIDELVARAAEVSVGTTAPTRTSTTSTTSWSSWKACARAVAETNDRPRETA